VLGLAVGFEVSSVLAASSISWAAFITVSDSRSAAIFTALLNPVHSQPMPRKPRTAWRIKHVASCPVCGGRITFGGRQPGRPRVYDRAACKQKAYRNGIFAIPALVRDVLINNESLRFRVDDITFGRWEGDTWIAGPTPGTPAFAAARRQIVDLILELAVVPTSMSARDVTAQVDQAVARLLKQPR
jgi:hypothetical protein